MRKVLLTVLSLLALAAPIAAQEGIRLSGEYDPRQRPHLAVRPFTGAAPITEAVDSIFTIMRRDLQYSDRYNVFEAIPQQLLAGDVDYRQWTSLGVTYVISGAVLPTARGYELSLAIHDAPYGRVVNDTRFALPATTAPDFRMAVHALADHVVQRTLNAQGAAATRIAFTRKNPTPRGTNDDLLIVDSDGYSLRRIAGFGGQLYSPAWSPDARRILYAKNTETGWQLVERDITSGSERAVSPDGRQLLTPSYAPDGRKIVLGVWRDNGTEIFEYDLAQQCCMRKLTGSGRTISMNPVFSPDGRQIAFNSDRAGNNAIYLMPAQGADVPTQISPFGSGSYYTSPSWSPAGDRIAFHGQWSAQNRGKYQIMLADPSRPGAQIEQLTTRGENEDPSWAPDGRHLVYTGVGDGEDGLYVIDIEMKYRTRRLLVSGQNMRMAAWSPPLVRAADLIVR